MKLYVLRHGETNYNRLGLCNDDPRTPVYLTERGFEQAQRAAQQLREVRLQRILTSQLPRTQQTAAVLNAFHQLPIEPHELLNDIRSGYDGKPVTDYFAATANDPLHVCANGGESLLDYKARIFRFIDWLATQPQATSLIVAHEETLRMFEAYFHQVPDESLRDLHFANCEVHEYVLECAAGDA